MQDEWRPAQRAGKWWRETLTGEALLFGLLSRLLQNVPGRSWLRPLARNDMFGVAPFAAEHPLVLEGLAQLRDWAGCFRDEVGDEALTALKVDHTRLFTGVGPLPVAPWESVYFSEERMLFQERTMAVRKWYRRFRLERVNSQEPDDHIGLEMAFLAHLATLALNAEQSGDEAGMEEALQAQRAFLSEHLLQWGPLWASLVVKHARTDFYQGLASLAWGALEELAAIFELAIPEWKHEPAGPGATSGGRL